MSAIVAGECYPDKVRASNKTDFGWFTAVVSPRGLKPAARFVRRFKKTFGAMRRSGFQPDLLDWREDSRRKLAVLGGDYALDATAGVATLDFLYPTCNLLFPHWRQVWG